MKGMQQNQFKQLEMMASFMGSLLKVIFLAAFNFFKKLISMKILIVSFTVYNYKYILEFLLISLHLLLKSFLNYDGYIFFAYDFQVKDRL